MPITIFMRFAHDTKLPSPSAIKYLSSFGIIISYLYSGENYQRQSSKGLIIYYNGDGRIVSRSMHTQKQAFL